MRKNIQALGRLKVGQMNDTEAAYAQTLELRKRAGEIAWYKFEGLKFRLADKTFYTPDFAVMKTNGLMECHEVKGQWLDDARASKIPAISYRATAACSTAAIRSSLAALPRSCF